MADLVEIEKKINTDITSRMGMDHRGNGAGIIQFQNLQEMLEFAKIMATARGMVPEHLVGNPGACMGIILQSQEWGFSPYQVAQKSYIAKQGQPLAYESQMIHAVIERNAPLKGKPKLNHRFEGDGDSRICIVWGTFIGSDEPKEWKSLPLGKRRPRQSDRDAEKVKGSPLWLSKTDLQQFYDNSRDWARVYCPDVILGAYTREEMMEVPGIMRDVTPDPFATELPPVEPAAEPEGGESAQQDRKPFQMPSDLSGMTDMRVLQTLSAALNSTIGPNGIAAVEAAFSERIEAMAEDKRDAARALIQDSSENAPAHAQ